MKEEDFNVEDMNEEDDFSLEDMEDDDFFGDWISFGELMYNALSNTVKKFLNDYYGERMYNLDGQTFREIDSSIKGNFIFADEIPDILFRHRTITDPEKIQDAFEKFKPSNKPILWKKREDRFDGYIDDEEDEDDENVDPFFDHTEPEELSEDQLRARKIVDLANEIISESNRFDQFMHSGNDFLMKEFRIYIENEFSFDLSILSPDGFEELQDQLDLLINTILEDLDTLVWDEIKEKNGF